MLHATDCECSECVPRKIVITDTKKVDLDGNILTPVSVALYTGDYEYDEDRVYVTYLYNNTHHTIRLEVWEQLDNA